MARQSSIGDITLPWLFDRKTDRHVALIGGNKDTANERGLLATLALQTLKTYPAGSAQFLFIDKAGAGRNFAAFGELRESSAELVSGGIVLERDLIRKRLENVLLAIGELNTNKLGIKFDDIDGYNEARARSSGSEGEPYRFIFIADFPTGFDSESCSILDEILESGPRCGVHVFLNTDDGAEVPYGVDLSGIIGRCTRVNLAKSQPKVSNFPKWAEALPIRKANKSEFIRTVSSYGEKVQEHRTRTYDFDAMMQAIYASSESRFAEFTGRWTGSTEKGLEMPLGLGVGGKVESNTLGMGEGDKRHNMLVLGSTGTGKSNLLHVAIRSMAELYSPDELSLYLMDSKSGTEFRPYLKNKLPHAEVIALRRNSEFGLSVLRSLDAEQERRNRLFGMYDSSSLEQYRQETGKTLPRIVAIFDEFQELLAGSDHQSIKEARDLLESITRMGRSAGVHCIFSTQSVAGLDIPSAMLEQVGVRICLSPVGKSRGVLDDDNKGSDNLRRFQALNNSAGGDVSGNSVFQVAAADKQGDSERRISDMARQWHDNPARSRIGPRIVFDGGEPASLQESQSFDVLVTGAVQTEPHAPVSLLVGEPIAVAETYRIDLARRADNNALFFARDVEDVQGSIVTAMLSALASRPPWKLEIDILDATLSAGSPLEAALDCLHGAWPEAIRLHRNTETIAGPILSELQELVTARRGGTEADVSRILVILGMQEIPYLEDEGIAVTELMRQGPGQGLHILGWCDSMPHLKKILANDYTYFGFGVSSPSLIPDLSENRLYNLPRGRNRLYGFTSENMDSGRPTPIRAFALPAPEVISGTVQQIQRRTR